MLELRRGRQHVVRVIGGVGHEVFEHDGEQVFACKAACDFTRLRRDRHRIAVVDDQCIDRRIGVLQVVADGRHVDRAWSFPGEQAGPVQRFGVDRIRATGGQKHAACSVAPVTGQCRQAGHRPHGIAAAAGALHAVVEPNHRGAGLPVVAREVFHLGRADAADRCNALRIELLRALFEAVITQRIAFDVIQIEPPFAHQHVHHTQRERGVGAWHQRNVLMAFFGRQRAVRIDRDQFGAAPLRLLRTTP